MPDAGMKTMTAGNGPAPSGWNTTVFISPSRVRTSCSRSIIRSSPARRLGVRHPRESGGPYATACRRLSVRKVVWTPAFAGVTFKKSATGSLRGGAARIGARGLGRREEAVGDVAVDVLFGAVLRAAVAATAAEQDLDDVALA